MQALSEENVKESQADGWTEPRYEDNQPEFQPKTKISLHVESEWMFSNLFDKELEFSRSLSSIMIWPDDMEDSSCLARHCSVLRMSRR